MSETGGTAMAALSPGHRREAAARRREALVGLCVLVALCIVLFFALGGRQGDSGHELRASFSRIDGLGIGSDVKIAGVTVGHVTGETVDPSSYLATVRFSVRSDIHLPVDSSAAILSESLLGGKYLSLSPGGDTRVLAPDGLITATQGSIGLDALLGKFITSVTGLMDAVKASGKAGTAAGVGAGAGPAGPLGP